MSIIFHTEFKTYQGELCQVEAEFVKFYDWPQGQAVNGIIRYNTSTDKSDLASRRSERRNNNFSPDDKVRIVKNFLDIKLWIQYPFAPNSLTTEILSSRICDGVKWTELPADNIWRQYLSNEPYCISMGGYHVPYLPDEVKIIETLQDNRYAEYRPDKYRPSIDKIKQRRWVREIMYREMEQAYQWYEGRGDTLNAELLEQEKKDARQAEDDLLRLRYWWAEEGYWINESKKSWFERLFG